MWRAIKFVALFMGLLILLTLVAGGVLMALGLRETPLAEFVKLVLFGEFCFAVFGYGK